jgi:hypothetical protein
MSLPALGELPELEAVERLLEAASRHGRVEVLAQVPAAPTGPDGIARRSRRFPIHGVTFGSTAPDAPTLAIVGGVHGLERIGAEVAIAYLTTLVAQLGWDELLQQSLERCRIAVVPLLNPVGMAARRRANGNGVDLMRNAPPHPDGGGTPLVGGQRLSPRLPWYMGPPGAPMEPEAAALVRYFDAQVFGSRFAISLDLHSGFGMIDRLWFPYARTRAPLPHLAEVFALKQLLDRTLPNHVYRMEPTARAYTIRGDLWDHLYDRRGGGPGIFLPLTLEMGSWLWVKKNPAQILSALGTFNPVRPHRLRRTLRRHLPLLDFLYRATLSSHVWASPDPARRRQLADAGFELWFAR